MPLWKVYHPEGAFSSDEKKSMAGAIPDVYGRVMPRFYVNVLFEAVPAGSLYIGGELHTNFVRITVEHIARAFTSDKAKAGFMKHMNKVLKPWIEDRGFDWASVFAPAQLLLAAVAIARPRRQHIARFQFFDHPAQGLFGDAKQGEQVRNRQSRLPRNEIERAVMCAAQSLFGQPRVDRPP